MGAGGGEGRGGCSSIDQGSLQLHAAATPQYMQYIPTSTVHTNTHTHIPALWSVRLSNTVYKKKNTPPFPPCDSSRRSSGNGDFLSVIPMTGILREVQIHIIQMATILQTGSYVNGQDGINRDFYFIYTSEKQHQQCSVV